VKTLFNFAMNLFILLLDCVKKTERKMTCQHDLCINSGLTTLSLGTNLIHDFTAVTFSMKLAFFREKRRFP